MALIRFIGEAEDVPRGYAVAYRDYLNLRHACAPIGLHWLIGLYMAAKWAVKGGWGTPVRKRRAEGCYREEERHMDLAKALASDLYTIGIFNELAALQRKRLQITEAEGSEGSK